MSDVTGLQRISNGYAATVEFTNVEHAGNNRQITALTNKEVGNAWIPWCNNKEEFKKKHMKIEAANLTLYIWQQGRSIRCTRDGWQENAPSIGGDSNIAQSVYWTIGENGSITQFKEG